MPSRRWTWMNLNMPSGDALAIWDIVNHETEESWATVLHRDGTHEVVEVEPMADGADEIWTSPTTGQKYPARWRVTIPELRAKLTVRITGTPGQELALDGNGRMEAAADFTAPTKVMKPAARTT
ncbi:lipocalin family protein [Sorangium sp. So ce388]